MRDYYKKSSDEIEKESQKVVKKEVEIKKKIIDLIEPSYKNKGWHTKTRKRITRKGA